jgi:hypothetical protein
MEAAKSLISAQPNEREPNVRRYLTRTVLAIVTIAVILGIWECAGSPYIGLGIRAPFESAAEYHLRMMYYHGRETKDGHDAFHGDQLVALGDRAVPVLAEAVAYGFEPRFDPKPHEMLARLPATAHDELVRRINTLKESPESPADFRRRHFLFQRVNLTTALILVSNDWTYLDLWLADVQERGDRSYYGDLAIQLMGGMLKELLDSESAPAPFNLTESPGISTINPEFVEWWMENGARVTARESAEGFHNAKGWKSGWFRDSDRLHGQ